MDHTKVFTEFKKKNLQRIIQEKIEPRKRKIYTKEKFDHYFSKHNWTKSNYYDTVWFLFQDVFSYSGRSITNHVNHTILKEFLKVFSMLMV